MFISTVFKFDSEAYTTSESVKTAPPAGSPELRKRGRQKPRLTDLREAVGTAMALIQLA